LLKQLPEGCRAGDNANAFLGGFRLWADVDGQPPRRATPPSKKLSIAQEGRK
jgi:polyphosphate glucokinase